MIGPTHRPDKLQTERESTESVSETPHVPHSLAIREAIAAYMALDDAEFTSAGAEFEGFNQPSLAFYVRAVVAEPMSIASLSEPLPPDLIVLSRGRSHP